MGQRDASIGAATGCGGDARHHLAVDAALQKELQLFGAATEDERVAALSRTTRLFCFARSASN